jgi:hypothetical protein
MNNSYPLYLLDIDLDAFLSDTVHWKSGKRRVSGKRYIPWSCDQLREFLENRCGLSRSAKIPGRYAIEHDAALEFMESLRDTSGLQLEVAHIDGHADLGLGDPSWVHLIGEWLAKEPLQRRAPPMSTKACNPGSFLAYAAAARLLAGVTYAFPPGGGNDFHTIFFHENNPDSGFLELKRFGTQVDAMEYESLTADRAISVEPLIPFQALPIEHFKAKRAFDRGFVCQSPGFTPKKSDSLLYVLAEYVDFDDESDSLPIIKPSLY